jgi:hypothetical protein
MDSIQKAGYLYTESGRYKEAGHLLVSEQLEKMADSYGRAFIKEALGKYKALKKQAVIEKPLRNTSKHHGLKKKGYSLKKEANPAAWAKSAWGALNPHVQTGLKHMGRGALYTAGGAAVAAPAVSYMVNRESDNLMGKVKEYAVPGALAIAGLAAGAYGASGTDTGKDLMKSFLPRRKVAFLIEGFKTREKLASHFGENSREVQDCESAISRLLCRGY